jgi:membrane peptidoglycan carboxypeptidase
MEKQSNRRRGQTQRARFGMILLNTFLMLLAIGMTLAVGMGFLLAWYFHRNVTPNFDEETSMLSTVAGPSQIYYYEFEDRMARIGEKYELPEGTLDGGVHSTPVTYAECPQALVDAFVTIEDQQFFLHH